MTFTANGKNETFAVSLQLCKISTYQIFFIVQVRSPQSRPKSCEVPGM